MSLCPIVSTGGTITHTGSRPTVADQPLALGRRSGSRGKKGNELIEKRGKADLGFLDNWTARWLSSQDRLVFEGGQRFQDCVEAISVSATVISLLWYVRTEFLGKIAKVLVSSFSILIMTSSLYSLSGLPPPHLILPANSAYHTGTMAHSASPNLTGPARVHITHTALTSNFKMPLKEVPRPYPLIDSDPHFSRVVRYMRPNDYALWAGAAAAGPGLLWLYGGC